MVKARFDDRRYEPILGVKTDFENLLQKFKSTGTVRYESFAKIWREMKMSMLCSGRQDDREVREFMEECIKIAKQFFLPPSNFQTRVGALYLLYGLYMTQPCLVKVKICVTSSEWLEILKFQSEASQQQHLDVDYIFHFLSFQKAFHFCATATEIYPLGRDTNEAKTFISDSFKEDINPLNNLFPSEVIEQLAAINDQYHEMKVELAGPGSRQPDTSLNVIQTELVQNITRTLNNYQKMEYGTTNKNDEDTTGEGSSRLKQRAFAHVAKASKSRRHRQVIEEFPSPESSPKKKRKLSPKKGKKSHFEVQDTEQEMKTEISDTAGSSQLYSMPQLSVDVTDIMKDTKKAVPKRSRSSSSKKKMKGNDRSSKQTQPSTNFDSPEQKASTASTKDISSKTLKKSKKSKKKSESVNTDSILESVTEPLEDLVVQGKKKSKLKQKKTKESVDKESILSTTLSKVEPAEETAVEVSDEGKKKPKLRAELPEPKTKKRGRPRTKQVPVSI